MATVQILVANPTAADVTVNAKVAKARKVTQLGLDDTTTEAEQFLAAKCVLSSKSASGSSIRSRLSGAYLLYRLGHFSE